MKKSIIILAMLLCSPAIAETPAEFFANDRARIEKSYKIERAKRARVHHGNVRGVHPRLIDFARKFNCRIISGYRPGARIRGTRKLSNHARGLAIDVNGCARGAHAYALRNDMGVGTYSRCSGFSHVHYSLVASERYHKGCGRKKRRR